MSVRKIAGAVAAALPGRWAAEDGPWPSSAFLVRDDGLELHVMPGAEFRASERGKLSISLAQRQEWIDHVPGNTRWPSIMVSASKAPEVIARDVVRRLLAGATELHGLLTKRAEARRAGVRAQQQLLAELVHRWSGQFHEVSDRYAQTYVRLGGYGDPVTATARVLQAAASVDFEVRVSGSNAPAFVEFLRELREQAASQTRPLPPS